MFVEKHEAPILMLRFSCESYGFRGNERSDKTRQNFTFRVIGSSG